MAIHLVGETIHAKRATVAHKRPRSPNWCGAPVLIRTSIEHGTPKANADEIRTLGRENNW